MYKQVEKSKQNKSKQLVNPAIQKKSNVNQGLELMDNRPKSNTEKIIQNKLKGHVKTCNCASCTGTTQMKSKSPSPTVNQLVVIQRVKCGDCGGKLDKTGKGHFSWCKPTKAPMKGDSHDDGSGVQKGGGKGDKHERGRAAAEKAQNKPGFYGQKKK